MIFYPFNGIIYVMYFINVIFKEIVMKITAKISVVIISVILLASCLLFAASAVATDPVTEDNYRDVLEYYGGYHLNEEFDSTDVSMTLGNYITDKSSEIVVQGSSSLSNRDGTAVGKYSVTDGVMTSTSVVEFKLTPDALTSFGVNITGLYNNKVANFDVYSGTTKTTALKIAGSSKITVGTNAAVVSSGLKSGSNYMLQLFCEVTDTGVNITATFSFDSAASETYTASLTGTYDSFLITMNTPVIDCIEIYEGSFPRRLNDNEAEIATYINQLAAAYDETNSETVKYLDVINTVVKTHGYKTDEITDSDLKAKTDASIALAASVLGNVCVENLIAGSDAIDTSKTYTERKAHAENLVNYDTLVKEVESSLDTDTKAKVDVARGKLETELAALKVIEDDTSYTVAMLNGLADLKTLTYAELRDVLKAVEERPICEEVAGDICPASDISAAKAQLSRVNSRISELDARLAAFIGCIDVASDVAENETPEQFTVRYRAYLQAKNNYFGDTSYNSYAPAGETDYIENLLIKYNAVDTEMTAVSIASETLIAKVSIANSLGYFEKVAIIESLKTLVENANLGYPGVPEAIDKYAELSNTPLVTPSGDELVEELIAFYQNKENITSGTKNTVTSGSFGINFAFTSLNGASATVLLGDEEILTVADGKLDFAGGKLTLTLTDSASVALFVSGSNAYVIVNGDVYVLIKLDSSVNEFTVTYSGTPDYVEAYESNFVCRTWGNEAVVAEYINAIVALYDTDDNATKPHIVNWIRPIYSTVIKENAYSCDAIADETLKAATLASVNRIGDILAAYYAELLVSGADGINSEATYTERKNITDTLDEYRRGLLSVLSDYPNADTSKTAAEIETAKAALEAELATLAKIKQDTVAAIEASKSISSVSEATYKQLHEILGVFEGHPIDPTYRDSDYTEADVENAFDIQKKAIKEYQSRTARALAFIENVLIADNTNVGTDESTTEFRARYDAYFAAKNNYFDDTTYSEVYTNVSISDLIVIYNAVDAEMTEVGSYAKEFFGKIVIVTSLNYFEKKNVLLEVAPYLDTVNRGYPGVEEAFAAYDDLVDFVNNTNTERLVKEFVEFYEANYYFKDDFASMTGSGVSTAPVFAGATDVFSFINDAVFGYEANNGEIRFTTGSSAYFNFVPEKATSFGMALRVKLNGENDKIVLNLHSSARGINGNEIIRLLSVKNGEITLYDKNSESTTYESNAKNGEYFDIELYYFAGSSSGSLSVTITLPDSTVENYACKVDGFDFKSFDLGVQNITMDSFEVYEGELSHATPDLDALSASYILEIVNAYRENNEDNYLPELVKLIINHGINTDALTDASLKASTDEAINVALETVANDYAAKLVAGAGEIDKTGAYNDRLDAYNILDDMSVILAAIQNNYSSVVTVTTPAADIDAARALVAAEKAELEDAERKTKAYYAAANSIADFYLANYKELRDAYDALNANPYMASFYDEELSAEELSVAIAYAEIIVERYEALNKQVEDFIENLLIADNRSVPENETPEAFRDRYDAYLLAKSLYFADVTYDGYRASGVMSVEELLELYESVNAEMVPISAYADEFISIIAEGTNTLSFSVKKSTLAQAVAYLDTVNRGYPGVKDAIQSYEALVTAVAAKEQAAKDYITAVLAIAEKTSVTEIKAAIAAAKALAANGSDVSVDATVNGISVTAANILLSDSESAIVLAEARVANFVNAVSLAKAAANHDAKLAAIVNAISLKSRADTTNASVIAAIAELDGVIAEYNAAISAANAAMETASNVATAVFTKTAPTKPVAQIVAIIKKFFED